MSKNKPIILFDANPLIGNKSGIGHYTKRLLEAFAENQSDNFELQAYYFNFLGLKKVTDLPYPDRITYRPVRFLPSKVLNLLHKIGLQLPLEFFLSLKRVNFIFFPNFVAIPNLHRIPYALVIHDMTFLDVPEFLPAGNQKFLQKFTGKSAERSSVILSISKFTTDRILHYYENISASKILTIPIPYENIPAISDPSLKAQDIASKPFVLFVGTLEPRKNVASLIYGFAKLPKKIRDSHRLVLVGGHGWLREKIDQAIEQTKGDIELIEAGYLSDADRDYLYKQAALVSYLSLYEGFGMQILEAIHYKKKLLLSSIPVFHEVAGDYATYCNPDKPEDVAAAIQKALTKPVTGSMPDWSWRSNASQLTNRINKILS